MYKYSIEPSLIREHAWISAFNAALSRNWAGSNNATECAAASLAAFDKTFPEHTKNVDLRYEDSPED